MAFISCRGRLTISLPLQPMKAPVFICISHSYDDIYRYESGRCHTLLSCVTYFYHFSFYFNIQSRRNFGPIEAFYHLEEILNVGGTAFWKTSLLCIGNSNHLWYSYLCNLFFTVWKPVQFIFIKIGYFNISIKKNKIWSGNWTLDLYLSKQACTTRFKYQDSLD